MALTKEQEQMLQKLIQQKEQLNELLEDNNLTDKDIMSPKQKKALKRAQSAVNICKERVGFAKFASLTSTLSLKKGAFVSAAKKELKRLIAEGNFFINIDPQLAGTHTVDIPEFTKLIAPIKTKTPLATALLTSFVANPSKMNTVQDIESLFSSLLNLLCDPKWLRSHYDSNKSTYLKEVKDITEENATEEIFKSDIATDFANLIKTIGVHLLSSINDPNYGPNKTKLEAKEEEEEKRLKAEFNRIYQEWLDQSIDNVTNIDSNISDKVLPRDIFVVSANDWAPLWSSAQPELTSRLLDTAKGELTKTDVSVAECAEALNSALQENYKITVGENVMFENWKSNKTLPNINGLISTINMVAGNDLQNEFNKVYIEWYKKEFDALDGLKWNNNDRFYKKKVLENLKTLLQGDDRAFMLPIFEGFFKNLSNIARVEDYIQEWKRGMNDVVEISNLKKQYDFKNEKQSDQNWIQSINLPSENEIQRLFDKEGKYVYVKPKAANGETVRLTVSLSDGSLLNLQVPTNIEIVGNKAFAVPTDVLLVSQNSGSRGYKFSIDGVALENTTAYEKDNLWVTPFDFMINFEKDAGELSTGTEHTDEVGHSSSTETTTTTGEENGTTTSTGGSVAFSSELSFNESATAEGSVVVVSGDVTVGSEQSFGTTTEFNYSSETEHKTYNESSTANAFENSSSTSDSYSSGETTNKGTLTGGFGIELSLSSLYIEPAQEGNNATIEAKLSADKDPYLFNTKNYFIENMLLGSKHMPATKE